jgi:hypothetical protein
LAADNFRIDTKEHIDALVDLIRKGNWRTTNFLYEKARLYCWKVFRSGHWRIPEDEVESIINYSIGKTLAYYQICGKFWGLLATIFVNDICDYLNKPLLGADREREEDEDKINQVPDNIDSMDRESYITFYRALSVKPKEQQICIQLLLEDFEDEQIQNILNTEKSVKDLKYHAKMNLKKVLVERFGWNPK